MAQGTSPVDRRGIGALLLAYAIWGLFPLYWRQLGAINPAEQVWVRLILTALFCIAILPLRGTWGEFRSAWHQPQILRINALAGVLLAINWVSFIWTIVSGNVMDSSLGYFLCPLLSIVLARMIEGEKLDRWQQLAVAFAVSGAGLMVLRTDHVPWAAFIIAISWAGYGLLKKRQPLGPVVSLSLECSLLSPLALAALWLTAGMGTLSLSAAPPSAWMLLAMSGAITAMPLILFAYAAPKVPLGITGMGQYIVPSSHFGLAIAFGEPLEPVRLASFALIWIGLLIFSLRIRFR